MWPRLVRTVGLDARGARRRRGGLPAGESRVGVPRGSGSLLRAHVTTMPFLLPISHQGDHTPAAECMIAVLLLAAAFQPPSPATLVGSDRRAVRMCSAEDAARERWLKNSGRG